MVVVGIALGVVVRVWVVRSPLGPPDSDESVVGLMARHFTHGEVRAFFWGQAYGGAHEAIAMAVLLFLRVPARVAIELVPILGTAAAAVLTWRVGRRILDGDGGAIAGVLVWAAPAAFVWGSTKERGFYQATFVAGLATVLFALRLRERPTVMNAAVLGLAAGTGWYASPQILYFVVPAGIWLLTEVVRDRATLLPKLARLSPVAGAAAVVGALPWLYANARSHGASLHPGAQPPSGVPQRFNLFIRKGLPYLLGIRTPHREYWPWGAASKALFVVALALLVLAMVRLPRRALVVPIAIVAYPLVFVAFTTSWYVNEPRYLYCLVPWLALAAGGALATVKGPVIRSSALVAIAAGTVVAMAALVNLAESSTGLWDLATGDVQPLVRLLDREGQRAVWAEYWVSLRVDLRTDERILAVPVNYPRYEPYERRIRRRDAPGYLLLSDTCQDRLFHGYLDSHAIGYRRVLETVDRTTYALYVLPMTVRPEDAVLDWATVRRSGTEYLC